MQADPLILDETAIGHAQGLGQELVERLRSDELGLAVAAAVGDPLGKDAEFQCEPLVWLKHCRNVGTWGSFFG